LLKLVVVAANGSVYTLSMTRTSVEEPLLAEPLIRSIKETS